MRARSNMYDRSYNSFICATTCIFINGICCHHQCKTLKTQIYTFHQNLDRDKPKANELFHIGNWKVNILYSKLRRMGCSQLIHDMHKISILSSPEQAQVGNSFPYFFECWRYIAEHDVLEMKSIPQAPFTLNTFVIETKTVQRQTREMLFFGYLSILYSQHFQIQLRPALDLIHIWKQCGIARAGQTPILWQR